MSVQKQKKPVDWRHLGRDAWAAEEKLPAKTNRRVAAGRRQKEEDF